MVESRHYSNAKASQSCRQGPLEVLLEQIKQASSESDEETARRKIAEAQQKIEAYEELVATCSVAEIL